MKEECKKIILVLPAAIDLKTIQGIFHKSNYFPNTLLKPVNKRFESV